MTKRTAFCMTLLAATSLAALGCTAGGGRKLPPAERLMEPGPGVTGPGPGVMLGEMQVPQPLGTSQLAFIGKNAEGMLVRWDTTGRGTFDAKPLVVPARMNFPQGAIYRLMLTQIPGRAGIELFPTVEIGPVTPRTEAYLAHNAIPIQFTTEDFDQVQTGNYVTKVVYLPDPEFQELALANIETLVSTRLDPGVDPIVEADRRGAILAVVRMGNKDEKLPERNNNQMTTIPPLGGIRQVGYQVDANGQPVIPNGQPNGQFAGGGGPAPALGLGPPYVAGVTAPQWGMAMSGTPIGLPGPPHVPQGFPAGLQSHVMRNWSNVHIPPPTARFRIDVKQRPRMSYPRPPHHMSIQETNASFPRTFFRPVGDFVSSIGQRCGLLRNGNCDDGSCNE